MFSPCWKVWCWIRGCVQLSCCWLYSVNDCIVVFLDVGMHRVHSESYLSPSLYWIPITWYCWTYCCWIQHDVGFFFVLWIRILLRHVVWFLLVDFSVEEEVEIRMNLVMLKVITYPLFKLHTWVQIQWIVYFVVYRLDHFSSVWTMSVCFDFLLPL